MLCVAMWMLVELLNQSESPCFDVMFVSAVLRDQTYYHLLAVWAVVVVCFLSRKVVQLSSCIAR